MTSTILSTIFPLALTAENNFKSHTAIACLIAGLIFFGFGLAVGWWIWRHYKAEALRTEKENHRLLDEHRRMEKTYQELKSEVKPAAAGE